MAHSLTVAFVKQMWQGPSSLPTYFAAPPGIPFELEELVEAVAKIHTNKSVAQPFLPGVVWRSAPREVASFVYCHLQDWWSQSPPIIPKNWKDSWLFFLPKPGKPNTHPDQLRPISLMEPLGKIVMGLITTKIKACIFPLLNQLPQFGFLPYRAATDAILRVSQHSRCIREMVAAHRHTTKNQIANHSKLTICGGLSLFLDLNRAFDSADRRAIFDHLIQLGTPPNLVQLAASWHEDTHYNLSFRGATTSVPVGKGLRQGCKLAPLLWVSFMDLFLRQIATITGYQWVHDCLTIYADDVHIGCQFRSKHELQTHLVNIGHTLDVIENLKLSLSYSKSFMLIAYAGTNARVALKGVLQRSPTGANIRVPRLGREHTCLPLRSKGSYLGVCISYHAFELQTWNHRKQASWLAFARLRAWLRSRQLTRAHRMYLWKTCVFTVLTYGLLATNVTIPVLLEFQGTVYKMVRTVLQDHSYITHNTHQVAFQQHRIDQPLDMLRALAMGLLQRIQRRATILSPHDFLRHLDWTQLHDLLHLIHSMQAHAPEVPISASPDDPIRVQARQHCPHCQFATDSIPNMRRHLTTHHNQPQYRTISTSPLAMTLNGKPQCNNCHFTFSSWKAFIVHVQRACCQVPPMLPTSPTDVRLTPMSARDNVHRHFQVTTQPFWPELERCLHNDDWPSLCQLSVGLEHLTHHCAICGTWCNRFQELHSHYRLYHDEQLKGGVVKGAQLTQVMQLASPCALCNKQYSRVHSCPVTLQIGILRLQLQEPDIRAQQELTCEICVQQFDDQGQLYQHMARDHNQTLSDWVPSRDSVQGSDQCRHCSMQFDSRSGLRRHITEGRCEAFDPLASQNPTDNTNKWSTWLHNGDFSPTGLSAHQRLQLTTTCQFCEAKYMRTGDVVAHLLQSHGPLWNASQPMLRYLLQVVMASRGCICNPQAHEVGLAHICTPLRQVAMMMVNSDVQLLVPTQFHVDTLAPMLTPLRDEALTQRVIASLVARDFAKLWTDTAVVHALKSRCMTCGGHYQPAELLRHLLTVHPQTCAWATQIAFQLHDLLPQMQPQDFQCTLCQQIYNLPAPDNDQQPQQRVQIQRSHFVSSCPVVLQIAILLQPIHGRSDGSQRPGPDGWIGSPGSSSVGPTEASRGKRRRTASQAAQGQGQRRPRTRRAQQGGDHNTPATDGPTSSQPREEHPAQSKTGLLRFVLPKSTGGHCSSPHDVGQQVAGRMAPAEGQHEMAQPQDLPDEGSDHRTPQTGPAAGSLQTRRPALGRGGEQRHHSPGRGLELPEVVTGDETVDQGLTQPSGHVADAQESPDLGGALPEQRTRGAVPEPQEQPEQSGSNPVDLTDLTSRSRSLGTHGGALPQHRVVDVRHVGQTAFPGALETSLAPPPSHGQRPPSPGEEQRPRERQDIPEPLDAAARQSLRDRALRLAMANPGNDCYANSAFVSMIWATLSRSAFTFQDWGARSAILQQTLELADGTLFSLENASWFQHLLEGWNEDGEQADSAEFAHMLSSWTAMPAISNCWERRVQTEQSLVLHDAGDKFMPLTLQFDPQLVDHHEIQLSALLRTWHTELGMLAGLTDPEDLLLLHVDRMIQAPDGTVVKCQAALRFGWEVQIPVLGPHTCTWMPYTVIACIAHMGGAQNGHYQAILRTYPEVSDLASPSMWMLCDDGHSPQRILNIPEIFAQGITCLWMCQTSKADFHRLAPGRATTGIADSDLLALLATQPDPEP